jgi:drug/metabolite transporter (DMT)-like permease
MKNKAITMSKTVSLLLTFLCVLMISSGQVLFKSAALQTASATGVIERWLNTPLIIALVIYGVATLLWIWVLRHTSLSLAYPMFALAFLIVPLLAHFFLQEPVSIKTFIGGALIIAGVLVATQA